MIYPPSTNITYTAVGSTVGMPTNTFTYSWTFDDSTTGSGNTLSKSWSTAGDHNATVVAVDNVTLSSATTQKSIYIFDVATTISWTNTTKKFTANTPIARTGANYFFGNEIIMFGVATGTSDRASVGVYNMDTNTMTTYASALPGTGGAAGACQQTLGLKTGYILLWGTSTGDWGWWIPASNTYLSSGQSLGQYGTISGGDFPSCVAGNFIICTGYNNASGNYCILEYDMTANTFNSNVTEFTHGVKPYHLFGLPSGNALALIANSTTTYIYNKQLKSIVSGPSLSQSVQGAYNLGVKMNDGTVSVVTGGASAKMSVFTEDTSLPALGAWVDRVSYPYTSQLATATGNVSSIGVLTPGGDYLEVAGQLTGTPAYKPKAALFLQTNSTFYLMSSAFLTNSAPAGFCGYYGGKFWAVDMSTSTVYYSSPWSR